MLTWLPGTDSHQGSICVIVQLPKNNIVYSGGIQHVFALAFKVLATLLVCIFWPKFVCLPSQGELGELGVR